MPAATDLSARVLAALLPLVIVACAGGSGVWPQTAPARTPSQSAPGGPKDVVDLTMVQRAIDGETATALRITGRIVSAGTAVSVDLLLTRSGAMRLEATDGSGRAVISNGSRLWVVAAGNVTEAEAWSISIEEPGGLLGALSVFDLVEALLPSPWPLLDEERTTASMARTPEGLWVTAMASVPVGPQVARRRVLVDLVGGRVLRRERYDLDGSLELSVEGVAAAGASVSIELHRANAELTLQIDTLVRDPEFEATSFRLPR